MFCFVFFIAVLLFFPFQTSEDEAICDDEDETRCGSEGGAISAGENESDDSDFQMDEIVDHFQVGLITDVQERTSAAAEKQIRRVLRSE